MAGSLAFSFLAILAILAFLAILAVLAFLAVLAKPFKGSVDFSSRSLLFRFPTGASSAIISSALGFLNSKTAYLPNFFPRIEHLDAIVFQVRLHSNLEDM